MTDVRRLIGRTARDNLITLGRWLSAAQARGDTGAVSKIQALVGRWTVLAGVRPPAPDWGPPAGHHYEAVPETRSDWRVWNPTTEPPRACRQLLPGRICCDRQAVAALSRRYRDSARWWWYCPEHLYGRWVEDGRIMCWVARPD